VHDPYRNSLYGRDPSSSNVFGHQGLPQSNRKSEVVKRGDHVMGFSHEATTHHFRLFKDGGETAVNANDAKDKSSIDQIRTRLGHIAQMFADGNFNAPTIIHDANPPGVAAMTRLKCQIRFEFSEIDRGARIRLVAVSPETRTRCTPSCCFKSSPGCHSPPNCHLVDT